MANLVDAAPRNITPELSPQEKEFGRKKLRINSYLNSEEGRRFLLQTWDEEKWQHVRTDGSVKQVYRPVDGLLADEEVCLRKNVSDKVIRSKESARELRRNSKLLPNLKDAHFVKVYAHAPLSSDDYEGIGPYDENEYWEIVDYVNGTPVERIIDSEYRLIWPDALSPAVRLSVLLAACDCELAAALPKPPVYLTDLKTDAFIVGANGSVKMVDIQYHEEYVESSQATVATELSRLCIELFPGNREIDSSAIERAIRGYLSPDWDREDRKVSSSYNQPPYLSEILRDTELPDDVRGGLLRFLDKVRDGKLKYFELPADLSKTMLPIAQRVKRQEASTRIPTGNPARTEPHSEIEPEYIQQLEATQVRFIQAAQILEALESGKLKLADSQLDTVLNVLAIGFPLLPAAQQRAIRLELETDVADQAKTMLTDMGIFNSALVQAFAPLWNKR